jgi:hypothetical protein
MRAGIGLGAPRKQAALTNDQPDYYGAEPGTSDYAPVEGDADTPLLPVEPGTQDGPANPPVLPDGLTPEGGLLQPIDRTFDGDLGPPVQDGSDGFGGIIGGGPLPPAPPPTGGLEGSVYAKIQELLNRKPTDTTAASDAFRTAQGRAFDRNRGMLAERAAAQGFGGSGAFETGLNGLAQQRGEAEANFDATNAMNAEEQNTQTILQALGLGGNLVNQQKGLDLNAAQFEQGQNADFMRLILSLLGQQGAGAL